MKIGIITHYYNSRNYGGNLQAYALCSVLRGHGYDAEQIAYDKKGDTLTENKGTVGVKRILRGIQSRIKKAGSDWRLRQMRAGLDRRHEAIRRFNEDEIPHSRICYRKENIAAANQEYDVFITGSDQVWHPKALCGAYFLDFAEDDKVKLSYAASVAADHLTAQMQERFRMYLASFDAVSVRERDAVGLIGPLSPKAVHWVLDPTLLLEREQWDELCAERRIAEPYLFCYFLGDSSGERKLAAEYAAAHGLRIVTIPHLDGKFKESDVGFGDHQLYDVSPGDFISLIKNADCIFTDSFHGTVFSIIYEKEFFAFQRSGYQSMSGRLYTLTELIGAEARFCDTPERCRMEYIERMPPLAYGDGSSGLEEMRRKSLRFLLEAINRDEEKKVKYENKSA